MKHSFKPDLPKFQPEGDWKESNKAGSIRQTMIDEGNNCVFMSKFIKNVAIRWNKEYHITHFSSQWSKREPQDENNHHIDPISEILIEFESQETFEMETFKLEIKKSLLM